jgi:hypothetical protein
MPDKVELHTLNARDTVITDRIPDDVGHVEVDKFTHGLVLKCCAPRAPRANVPRAGTSRILFCEDQAASKN